MKIKEREIKLPYEKTLWKGLVKELDGRMTLSDKIKSILEVFPNTRDSDIELYARYLKIELPEQFQNLLVISMLKLIKNGVISSFDTVSRCRRKLQEDNELLRGEHYDVRQDFSENVKKDVGGTLF